MKAHYWGEAGEILSVDEAFILVSFPDGEHYRFPRGIIGLELPPECHTFVDETVTRRCTVCHRPMRHRRRQTKTCSAKCRKALSRRDGQ